MTGITATVAGMPDAHGATYKWVPAANGAVPKGAFIGGQEKNRKLYVCRVRYKGGVHPGKVVGRNCNIGWGGKEITIPRYEVLVLEGVKAAPPPKTVAKPMPKPKGVNLAKSKKASQSSEGWGGKAHFAIDGNRNQKFNAKTSNHTGKGDRMPWWEVDLGAVYKVEHIRIFNRTDCCGERIRGANVILSDQPIPKPNGLKAKRKRVIPIKDVRPVYDLKTGGGGVRFVRVQLPKTGFLHMAEVEIYGNPKPLKTAPPKPKPLPGGPMACLKVKPAPTGALVTYGGKIKPAKVKIEQILPLCLRFNYSGNGMWTRTSAAGGVSCEGRTVKIDYGKANSAFNGVKLRKFTPAACGPKKAPPKAAPVAKGRTINIYYGKTTDMYPTPLRKTTDKCYEISYGGNKMWFPKSAYKYRTDFVGNPPGLNYGARRNKPC